LAALRRGHKSICPNNNERSTIGPLYRWISEVSTLLQKWQIHVDFWVLAPRSAKENDSEDAAGLSWRHNNHTRPVVVIAGRQNAAISAVIGLSPSATAIFIADAPRTDGYLFILMATKFNRQMRSVFDGGREPVASRDAGDDGSAGIHGRRGGPNPLVSDIGEQSCRLPPWAFRQLTQTRTAASTGAAILRREIIGSFLGHQSFSKAGAGEVEPKISGQARIRNVHYSIGYLGHSKEKSK
jgi:hypothetical protein